MIITKAESTNRKIFYSFICYFHKHNPDQEGIRECKSCIIIEDPCGCGEEEGCSLCDPTFDYLKKKEKNAEPEDGK